MFFFQFNLERIEKEREEGGSLGNSADAESAGFSLLPDNRRERDEREAEHKADRAGQLRFRL